MESAHPFSVSFAPCFQAVLCRSQLFFRMFLDKLFQICADRFIMKQKRRCFSPFLLSPSSRRAWIEMYNKLFAYYTVLRRPPHGEHTSNPLSIRLHAPSFLQASHRFGGRRLFPCKPASPTFPPLASSCAVQNKSKRRHDPLYGPRRLLLQGSFACSTQAQYPGSG